MVKQGSAKKNGQKNEKNRIWWANHGRTFSKAKEGGYLWAPKPVKDGNTFPHWESMTKVKPGDLVLNFSGDCIVAFGIAKNSAVSFTEETKNKNMAGKEGWRVDLDFFDLLYPLSIEELQPCIEGINHSIKENKPFNNFGGVNNGYLFNFSLEGIKLIADQFIEKIPEDILNYLEQVLESDFLTYLRKKGLVYSPSIIRRYVLSLHTRALVVLTGKTGVGKTALAVNYATYLNDQQGAGGGNKKDVELFSRRWFKLSYNDKKIIDAFDGNERKIDQVRATMLNNGLVPLGWDNRDLAQKKKIKELKKGDVVVAYQGAYIIGGIGIITHPHFVDETGDAFDTFCESSQNFIRVEWLFSGPLRIKDFTFNEYDIPGFGMWVDTIHEMKKGQIYQFSKYLESKNINLSTQKEEKKYRNYALITAAKGCQNKKPLFGEYFSSEGRYDSTAALELILSAAEAFNNGSKLPFFLIIDELQQENADNYIIELLTAMEAGEPVTLHDNDDIEQGRGIPKKLELPLNLFVVATIRLAGNGTGLPQKIVDHSNLIPIGNISVREYFEQAKGRSFNKDLPHPEDSEINRMSAAEIIEQMSDVVLDEDGTQRFADIILSELELFQRGLEATGAALSLRSVNEIFKYLYTSWTFANQPVRWLFWSVDFDAQIEQRILPLLEDTAEIKPEILKFFYCRCFGNKDTKKIKDVEPVDELLERSWQEALYKGAAKRLSKMMLAAGAG